MSIEPALRTKKLQNKHADEINTLIGKLAAISCKTGQLVRFSKFALKNNTVIVNACDPVSRDWLLKIVPTQVMWGQHLIAQEVGLCLKEAQVFLPGCKDKYQEALDLLAAMNPNLLVPRWHMSKHKMTKKGLTIFVFMSNEAVEELDKIDFKPYWYLTRAEVTMLA